MGEADRFGRERVPREAIDGENGVIPWELQQSRPSSLLVPSALMLRLK